MVARRYAFALGLLAATLSMVIGVTPAASEKTSSIPHVGFLGTSADNGLTRTFQRGLRELGYIEGENIIVDYRFNGARADLLPGLAQELVDLQPDAIVAGGAISAQALKRTTSRIPIIFAINPDPVSIGLVDNDERPSANLTGFSSVDPDEYIHDLQLLQQLVPGLSRVAFIADQDVADNIRAGQFLSNAFQTISDGEPQAILVLQQPVTGLYRARIAERAMSAGLPALFGTPVAELPVRTSL